MNKNSSFIIDDKKVQDALAGLSFSKMNSAYKAALKQSLLPIQKEARKNLRRLVKNANKKYVSKKTGKVSAGLTQEIKISINIKTEDEYGKVYINPQGRTKWFEKGTNIRKTTKGKNRGKIKELRFFKSAYDSKGENATRTLEENIKRSLIKKWDKR